MSFITYIRCDVKTMCYILFISHSSHWRYIKIAFRKYIIKCNISFLLLVSTQFVLSGGLSKRLYEQHYRWALDGFKLGGLFYLSLLLRVFYIYIYIYIYVCVLYTFFEQNVSVLSGIKYFKMATSLAIQESIIRVEIIGTLF